MYPILLSEGERLHEMVIELMQNGLSEDMAKEVARAEIYDFETEEAEEELEMTEQDRRAEEMWELFREMHQLHCEALNLQEDQDE